MQGLFEDLCTSLVECCFRLLRYWRKLMRVEALMIVCCCLSLMKLFRW